MTDDELFKLAAKGANTFYRVYHTYPSKIGVHQSRNGFRKKRLWVWIVTIENPYTGLFDFTLERFKHPTREEREHLPQVRLIPFVPLFGYAVEQDTVWLYHPDISDWVSVSDILSMDNTS